MSNGKGAGADPWIGRVLTRRYRIVQLLGKGGMGTVYLAEQLSMGGRLVAVKLLHGQYAHDDEFVARFRREAQSAAAIQHRGVVHIYDFEQTESGDLFIVMEYAEGTTLKDLIWPDPSVPVGRAVLVGRAVRLGIQIAEGLEAAHEKGIIHRDIKLENIVVQQGDKIKLMNFGIAYIQDAQTQTGLTRTGGIIGTPEYLAPEYSTRGVISQQMDIYAWGIVLYAMLTGRLPFTPGPTPMATALKHERETPKPLWELRREIPEAVAHVVMQALEKQPQQRQKSMGEVIRALREATGHAEAAAPAQTVVSSQSQTSGQSAMKRWAAWAVIGVGTAVVSAAIVWVVTSQQKNPLNPVVIVPPEGKASLPPPSSGEQHPVSTTTKPDAGSGQTFDVTESLALAKFYQDRGQYDEAMQELEKTRNQAPNNANVIAALQRMRSAKEAEERLNQSRSTTGSDSHQ